jgi:hypothetical protein
VSCRCTASHSPGAEINGQLAELQLR